jgi:hypothetical protein
MTETIDPFAGAFTVDGWDGIAWRAIEYKKMHVELIDDEWVDNAYSEPIENTDWIVAVMIGDDRRHEIEVSEITMIDDDDYCSECGSMGCTHDGR